ncbi:hypothetical protein AB7C87_24120 [Natrarchaeobius sp. A-rgal3]|uniref:hypothetical protein n=1 Tax=Natrarchaeobius versutus TaxID=1679078 RepID=UPI00350EED64
MSGADDLEETDQSAAASDGDATGGAAPWPSQNNCVTHGDAATTGSGVDSERKVTPSDDYRPNPLDRAEDFAEEYPHLAHLPLTEQHGRSLRREVTEADYEPEYVEPEREWENGFVTYRLRERRAATWQDAVFAFLDAHERYEQGMSVRFSGTDETGEEIEFEVPLQDSWGDEYANKEYARAMAMERQLAGGEHPDGTVVEGEWDNLVTVMLTNTGSSVPDGDRVSPVDHYDSVSDAWSYGATRDTVRNICENDLGLESHEWGYLRFAEPHGVGAAADPDKTPGPNACYSHNHVGVYLDLDLEERYGSDLEHAELELEKAFRKAIDKHIEVCDLATFDAHNYTHENPEERPISVNSDVTNMGSYLSAYAQTYDDDDLIERPIEYVAWGAVIWSMNRQRMGRSKVLNEAIAADQCAAEYRDSDSDQQHDHGERLKRSSGRGSQIVCACCGSGFGIDQDSDTISEIRLEASPDQAESGVGHDRGDDGRDLEPTTDDREDWYGIEKRPGTAAARYGEPLVDKDLREQIERYVDVHGDGISPPELLGALDLNPEHLPLVKQVVSGDPDPPIRDSFSEPEELGTWEIEAFIDENGEEHRPSSNGGVDMEPTHLPVTHILEETRLQYVGEEYHPCIRCTKCNVAMYNPEMMAGHIVHTHNIEKAEYADHLLKFHYHSGGLPPKFDKPVSQPQEVD